VTDQPPPDRNDVDLDDDLLEPDDEPLADDSDDSSLDPGLTPPG
jgi:hypothetical protein